jgi:hypothetical protein
VEQNEASWKPLLYIPGPMLLTFVLQRIILPCFSHPNFHVLPGGYRVHHLFTGALI